MAKRRSPQRRRDTVPSSYNGMTLAHWQSSREHIEWAQSQPVFRDLLAVVVNARNEQVSPPTDAVQAARALGQREGYEHMIVVLQSLAVPPPRMPSEPEPTYPPVETNEQLD